MTLQDVWIDFKIISMIEPNRKLYIHDDVLALEPVSLLQPVKRWLSSSNRRSVIQRMKQRVEELESYVKKRDYDDKYWLKEEIIKLIDPVKNGLINLQNTYLDDSQVHANIELIIARLEYIKYMDDNSLKDDH
jgi:hypothetical protein